MYRYVSSHNGNEGRRSVITVIDNVCVLVCVCVYTGGIKRRVITKSRDPSSGAGYTTQYGGALCSLYVISDYMFLLYDRALE